MSSIKDRLNEPAPTRPGVGGELKHLRQNGQASAAEIREFLKSVQGKSPQEVLGVVAQSGLASGIVLATIGCIVLLVVGSVIPYALNRLSADAASAKPAKTQQAEAPAEKPDSPAKQAAAAPPQAGTEPATANPVDTLPDKLGIGETKAADPKKNPLDSGSDIDKLLDGID